MSNWEVLKNNEELWKSLRDLSRDSKGLECYSYLSPVKSKLLGTIQQKFFLSEKVICGIVGPNKVGKSYCGTAKFCSYVTGIYPDWFPEHLRLKTPVRGRIILNDFGIMYSEDMLPFLEKWIPKRAYDPKLGDGYRKKNNAGIYTRWQLSSKPPFNGSSFHIISNEQDVSTCEGAELDILLINEPCDEDKFSASMRGGVMGGIKVIFVLTPLGLSGWIIDRVVPREDAEIGFADDIRDNYTLNEKAIKSFELSLNPDEREARMYGKPLHFAGRVFKEFDRDVHCIPRYDIPKNWNRYLICDPHERKPFAFLWGAVNPQHQIIWYDYIWESGKTVREFVELIKQKEGNDRIAGRIMDCHYLNKNLITENRTLGEEFSSYNIHFDPSSADKTLRVMMMREYLKYDKQKPITAFNQPAMYWFDDLPEPIRHLERYAYAKGSKKEGKDVSGKTQDKDSDFADDAGYLAVEKKKFIKPLSQIVIPKVIRRKLY